MTDIHERLRLRARTARAARKTSSHYLIAGLAVGGLWRLNGDKSLLYHAVQMLAVMSAVTVLQLVLDRRHGRAPAYGRRIGAKLVLVALAVGAEWLLSPVTSRSNTIVAVGLVVLITAVGPVLDRLAARRWAKPTAALASQGVSAHSPADPARVGQVSRSPSGTDPVTRTVLASGPDLATWRLPGRDATGRRRSKADIP